MRLSTAWPAFLFLFLCFEMAWAAPVQNVRLYVDNSEGDDVSVIDLNTLNTVGDIRLAAKVHGLAIQANGRRLFATIESDNTLRVVDTAPAGTCFVPVMPRFWLSGTEIVPSA